MSAYKYQQNGVTMWRALWREPVGGMDDEKRQRSKRGFATKRAADAYVRARLAEIDQGYVALDGEDITVEWWLKNWLGSLTGYAPTTMGAIKRDVHTHLIPHLGSRKLTELQPNDLRRFYSLLYEHGKRTGKCRTAYVTCRDHKCAPENHDGLARKTITSVHFALKTALSQAVRDGVLRLNPCDASDLLPRSRKRGKAIDVRQRTWSPAQLREFLEFVADDRMAACWRLAFSTGMRRAELAGLRWANVDLDAGSLNVRDTIVVADGVNLEQDETKTPSGQRTIMLDGLTVSHLKMWKRRQAGEALAHPGGYNPAGYVFTDIDGQFIKPAWLSTHFTRLVKRSGLPKITLHEARHTHASILLSANTPINLVSQRLGHKDVLVTMQLYSHALPSEDSVARDAWAGALGDS